MDLTLAFFLGALVGSVSVLIIHVGLVFVCDWIIRNWH